MLILCGFIKSHNHHCSCFCSWNIFQHHLSVSHFFSIYDVLHKPCNFSYAVSELLDQVQRTCQAKLTIRSTFYCDALKLAELFSSASTSTNGYVHHGWSLCLTLIQFTKSISSNEYFVQSQFLSAQMEVL